MTEFCNSCEWDTMHREANECMGVMYSMTLEMVDKYFVIRDVCSIIDKILNEETQGTYWFSPSVYLDNFA